MMRRILDELIDGCPRAAQIRGPGPAVRLPMAAMTICEILGVPFEDHVLFVSLTDTVLDRSSAAEQAVRAATS